MAHPLLFHAVAAFFVGAVAVLLVHQPVIALLHAAGLFPVDAFSLRPTSPFGLPVFLSLAFWGGVWTVPIALALNRLPRGWPYWAGAVLLCSIPPSLTSWFIIAPLKGLPPSAFARSIGVGNALLANGIWGVGVAILWSGIAKVTQRSARSGPAGSR